MDKENEKLTNFRRERSAFLHFNLISDIPKIKNVILHKCYFLYDI